MFKKRIIVANEQAFQSIYLDPSAKKWKDVIVFHEPVFDEEISGIIALKSLRLENVIGFVIEAPANVLRVYKEKVKEFDDKEKWGKLPLQQIVDKLMSLATDLKASIAYQQNMKEYRTLKSKEKVDEVKKAEKAEKDEAHLMFDPVTKREIVKKGIHYFDPSLPTVEDIKELATKRYKTSSKLIYAPRPKVYPYNITNENKVIWDKVITEHYKEIASLTFNKDKWCKAKAIYSQYCNRLQITPYSEKLIEEPYSIWAKFKALYIEARALQRDIINTLYSLGILTRVSRGQIDAEKLGDNFCLTVPYKLRTNSINAALNYLIANYNFLDTTVSHRNIFKRVNARNLFNLKADNDVILAHAISTIPYKEAEILFNNKDETKLCHGILKGGYRIVKTGHITLRNFTRDAYRKSTL